MASVRPLLINTPRERATMALVPVLVLRSNTLAPTSTAQAFILKYRPLRQPQLNRGASTTSLPSSTTPTAASRSLHSSTTTRQAGAVLNHPQSAILPNLGPQSQQKISKMSKAPLSVLPLQAILRSLAVTTLSSSTVLLPPSLAMMNLLAHTSNPILDPDRNPLLHRLIKSTFYAQFCAGENAAEVRETMARLRGIGFSGVILGYAREVVLTDEQTRKLETSGLDGQDVEESVRNEVVPWANGTLETVRLAQPGDYVALKFTGAGRQALWTLSQRLPPPATLASAIDEICTLAASRGVRLLFDAEQQAVQAGIDDWTLHYMRKHNRPSTSSEPAKAVVFGTYQAYLKATPSVLAGHLHAAKREGFTLGVKLVRGAYLGSDPRHLIHDTKADTDAGYNGITEALLRRRWVGPLAKFARENGEHDFPPVNMVLASHNAETVQKAGAILESGERGTEVAFAQLQGMADEVSCEILAAKDRGVKTQGEGEELFRPRAYKYLVWGSTGECMKYLLRRAQENKDAVQRTKSGRDAMRAEVWRRFKAAFGLV